MSILVDAYEPDDIAAVNALQKQMRIKATSAIPFLPPPHIDESFEALLNNFFVFAPFIPDSQRLF